MKNGEKSFDRLFELVEMLAQTHNGMTGKALAELSGIPVSTTFRMLKFLVNHDFLCVDRSAMSNELCKMRDEGILQFEKNRFTLQ